MFFGRKKPDFSTREALAAFEGEVSALVRALDFDKAGKLILSNLDACGGPCRDSCRRIADSYIALDGWDDIWADIHTSNTRGAKITALGIDLSGYGDGKEPMLECALYSDGAHAFSTSSRADLLHDVDRNESPWRGRFNAGNDSQLEVRNLAGVYKLVKPADCQYWNGFGPAPKDYTPAALARWYIVLRVHHAVHRDLAKRGMPHAMPVIVGDHGFGVYFRSAYMAAQGKSREREVANILKARAQRQAKFYDNHTEELIADLRRNRSELRGWPKDHNPDKRATYEGYIQAKETMRLSILGISPGKPTSEMNDAEFKALIDQVRTARAQKAQERRAS